MRSVIALPSTLLALVLAVSFTVGLTDAFFVSKSTFLAPTVIAQRRGGSSSSPSSSLMTMNAAERTYIMVSMAF
jgi:hypothetical protein